MSLQHGHYRPDMVIRTAVVEPYDIQNVPPVEAARHTIDPFIYGIRPPGPSIELQPSAATIAHAAAAVAQAFAAGKSAEVRVGLARVTVKPDGQVPGGIVGQIVQCARGLMTGRPVLVESTGSKPVVAQASGGSVVVRDKTTGRQAPATPPTAVASPAVQKDPGAGSASVTMKGLGSYDERQVLVRMSHIGPTYSSGQVTMPQYAPVGLNRRVVPNPYQAGRAAMDAAAKAYPYDSSARALINGTRRLVGSLRRVGY